MDLAIIGLGSWGLSALERVVTAARKQRPGADSTVHVVEPQAFGTGVHSADQPDYLLLNNPCGQLSLWTGDVDETARYCRGLYDWASLEGYRWQGHTCRIGDGRAITPHDYLPRRVMGEYLKWFYAALLAEAPTQLRIVAHSTTAIDVVARSDGREEVRLADGESVVVDHVILTLGHTPNVARVDIGGSAVMEPYPVARYVDAIAPGAKVGVAGMGLVGIDVVIALTIGRGGNFVEQGNRLRYSPSGSEPQLRMFSRSGLPYCAKAVSGVDDTGSYQPVICTPQLLAGLAGSPGGVDLRADVLPAAFAEMQLRFLSQSARLSRGAGAAAEVSDALGRAYSQGNFADTVEGFAARFGRFDPEEHFFGPQQSRYVSSKDYQADVYEHLSDDLDESLMEGGSSPIKQAYEVWRINRDDLRLVTEYGGLSLSSYRDFEANIRNRVNRLIAGPPALRSQQLLALMDAGILETPYGPGPDVEPGLADGVTLRSRNLERPIGELVDCVVQGHLEHPTIHRSATPLLANLYSAGRLQQLHYGALPVGSVELDRSFHPLDRNGVAESHLSMFGVITEGTRYFTHYLPSPKSRLRAVQDLGECVNSLIS